MKVSVEGLLSHYISLTNYKKLMRFLGDCIQGLITKVLDGVGAF